MSVFRTIVEVPEAPFKTGYGKNNLFMGSCFTESIGRKMAGLKFTVELNPFGILYNPVSVANGLRILLEKRAFTTHDLFLYNGLWHSFYHHSRFSFTKPDKALDEINRRIESASLFLKKTDFLFITFGTSRVYEWKETGKVVSNCHKMPASLFREFRLPVVEIVEIYRDLLSDIWEINPEMKVVFTVSPVRHRKDGPVENQRSKATLLLAIDRLTEGFGNDRCFYFPSYEIMMDELRDYRFYADDMVHISDMAVNYIYEKFENYCIHRDDINTSGEVMNLLKDIGHKPFHRETRTHLAFVQHVFKALIELETMHPCIDFQTEKNYICREINEIGGIVNQEQG